jgi:hypothetical protein
MHLVTHDVLMAIHHLALASIPEGVPGLFMLSRCGAGPMLFWANAELHISVTAVAMSIFLMVFLR